MDEYLSTFNVSINVHELFLSHPLLQDFAVVLKEEGSSVNLSRRNSSKKGAGSPSGLLSSMAPRGSFSQTSDASLEPEFIVVDNEEIQADENSSAFTSTLTTPSFSPPQQSSMHTNDLSAALTWAFEQGREAFSPRVQGADTSTLKEKEVPIKPSPTSPTALFRRAHKTPVTIEVIQEALITSYIQITDESIGLRSRPNSPASSTSSHFSNNSGQMYKQKSLSRLTKVELRELAESKGIVTKGMSTTEISSAFIDIVLHDEVDKFLQNKPPKSDTKKDRAKRHSNSSNNNSSSRNSSHGVERLRTCKQSGCTQKCFKRSPYCAQHYQLYF